MIFSHAELANFFKIIKKYPVTSLRNWSGENAIILRHDVDLDITAAYNLAKFEKKFGIDSTFYIMNTSNTYNPSTQKNRKLLKEMALMDFEIGLHFDPSVYGKIEYDEMKKKAKNEAAILSSVIDEPVVSISIHNPSIHKQLPLFFDFKNAYDARIFSTEKYISDSNMQFRMDIFEFIKRVKDSPIQILLHPLYYTPDGKKLDEIIYKFVCDFIKELDQSWGDNSGYVSIMKKDLLTFISDKLHGK